MHADIAPATFDKIEAASRRLAGIAVQTPVIRCDGGPPGRDIWLKLETLQQIGSFKLRPVGNAVLAREPGELADGIYTASSGNSALGVAWMARHLGLPATAVVPDNAPEAKLAKLRRLGAEILMTSFADWWQAIETARHPGVDGLYVDAVRDPAALAGDGTVGLELCAQLRDLDAVFVPFGGGGLACGIACAVRALSPQTRIVACELDTASPLKSALAAGRVVEVPADAGFISGVGYGSVLPEMWPQVSTLIDDVVTITLEQVIEAIRILSLRNRVIAEGAGAIPVAAALFGDHRYARVCSVVSGGNIEPMLFASIVAQAKAAAAA